MSDYEKAASDLKARLDAKTKRRLDLDSFFENVRSSIVKEVPIANAALSAKGVFTITIRQEAVGEPTIELQCGNAVCNISQDRSVPALAAVINGESGEKTATFVILVDESPVTAQRVSLAPAVEAKVTPGEVAASIVEELIAGAP